MPAKKTDSTKKLKTELATTKKTIALMKKQERVTLTQLAEDAYLTGYTDAMMDFDKKAEAMEKYMDKALNEFEKEYAKGLRGKKTTKKKGKKKVAKKKVTKKKTTKRKKK